MVKNTKEGGGEEKMDMGTARVGMGGGEEADWVLRMDHHQIQATGS